MLAAATMAGGGCGGWRLVVGDSDVLAGARAALGRQLAGSRRAAGLSQEQLAPLSGYSRSTIANITHALMNSGHLDAATTTASSLAADLDSNVTAHSPDSLSVYGSLLLRGAIAAAQRNDRQAAHGLLHEADDTGRRLGKDANLRWTAFGPTNVKMHRVHIAVTLGDAGTAIDTARTIDLDRVEVTERKASMLIDTARAFLHCGKHESAYFALRAGQDIAPQEIADRPAVHQLLRDLIAVAPPSVRRQADEFASQLGVTR